MVEFLGYPLCYVRGMGLCRWEHLHGNDCRGAVVPRSIEVLIRPESLFYPQTGRELSPDVPPPPPEYEEAGFPPFGPPPWLVIAVVAALLFAFLLDMVR